MLFFKKKKEIERPHKIISSQPLTLPELDTQIKNRINIIQQEFIESFTFIKKYSKTVSFFGSARTAAVEDDYKKAYRLARRASELGYAVITGGGPGIMEAANKGAFEEKGASVGFTIDLPREQTTNPYLNDSYNFNYFFARKVALTYAAEAYVYFPGGFGTLDELFEMLTLIQTNKIEKVPIILFGSYFWLPFKNFLIEHLSANGKIDNLDMNLFVITDSLDEAMRIIKEAPIREAN